VHPSRGSVENVYAVYQKPGVQMGVVQAAPNPVLDAMKTMLGN
jgi:hypothetical protein